MTHTPPPEDAAIPAAEQQPEARAVCEHFYASHCYRGMSIRLCMTCSEPDWGDLAEQLHKAKPAAIPAPDQQIGIALADTPAGQRLAITCLLPADAARQLAAAINQATAGMSAAGLTAAPSGLLVPGGTVQR